MVPEPSPDHPEFILAREGWRQHCWEFYAGSSKPNFSCRGCTLPGWCCEDILSCWDLYHFFPFFIGNLRIFFVSPWGLQQTEGKCLNYRARTPVQSAPGIISGGDTVEGDGCGMEKTDIGHHEQGHHQMIVGFPFIPRV